MDIYEACEYYMQQLEAVNQRELELLAVIKIARSALLMRGLNEVADMLSLEPFQALREHEAKIVAEHKQRAEAAEQENTRILDRMMTETNHLPHCNANHSKPVGGDMCICVRTIKHTAYEYKVRAETAEAKLRELQVVEEMLADALHQTDCFWLRELVCKAQMQLNMLCTKGK